MAVFFIDENFPDHPKAVAAGEPACWLYVCGLAYIRRNKTEGMIPKAAAHRLVSKNGQGLARRLVDARLKEDGMGLWEDRGSHYYVHDYREFNAKSLARQKQTSEASKARWRKAAEHANASANGHADVEANEHANAYPSAPPMDKDSIQVTKDPENHLRPQTPANAPPDDDDRRAKLIFEAIGLLAEHDLELRQTATGLAPVGDVQAWLTKARQQRYTRHAEYLDRLDVTHMQDPEELAEMLDTVWGGAIRRERTRQREAARLHCKRCDGNGWVEADIGGTMTRCPECWAA